MSDRTEDDFLDHLPYATNGRLDAVARAHLSDSLKASPRRRAAFELQREIGVQAVALARERARAQGPEFGYDRIAARIAAQARPAAADATGPHLDAPLGRKPAAASSWLDRLTSWWTRPQAQGWRLLQGLATGALASLAAMALLLNTERRTAEPDAPSAATRSAPTQGEPGAVASRAWLRVRFADDATALQMRQALAGSAYSLGAGPSAAGDYWLVGPAATGAAFKARLSALAFVRDVEVVEGAPGSTP